MFKKIFLLLLVVILIAAYFTTSCSKDVKNDSKFFDTYKEILIIRNKDADTSTANIAVRKLLKERNYTEQSFKDEFTRLSQDPNNFARKIDSVRNLAATN